MLLGGIGRAFDVHEIETAGMIRSIEVLKRVHEAGSSQAAAEMVAAAAPSRGAS